MEKIIILLRQQNMRQMVLNKLTLFPVAKHNEYQNNTRRLLADALKFEIRNNHL